LPMITLHTDAGVYVFNALAPSRQWESARAGRYVSTAWIPGNLLNEGTYVVGAILTSTGPAKLDKHVYEADVLSFQAANVREELSAKGDVVQAWAGAVSPLLEWTTRTEGTAGAGIPLQHAVEG
ncbi:MAG: hypothetical protein ABI783_09135, partial [Actinomycetota bacterium]